MPRPHREIVPNQPHHVTERGNRKELVFKDQEDYERYLSLLQTHAIKEGIKVPAFCLMPNHIHAIAIPPDEESLPRAMREVQSDYARAFNRKYGKSGHVWQGRYFSCSLEPIHLYRAVRYVEMNPVRAGLVDEAWLYPWSSASYHVGLVAAPPGLNVSRLDFGF